MTGGGVPDKVWKRFSTFKGAEGASPAERKLKVEGTGDMKSDKDQERIRKLLFKRFDEGPSSTPAKEKKGTPEPVKAPDKPSSPTYTPPPEDPMDKMLKYAMVGLAFVIAIVVMASLSNCDNFYFKQKDEMVEMWRGRFAPMGKGMVASFSDPTILEGLPEKSSYTKKEAYGVLSAYFIKQADVMLSAGRTPDLKGAKAYLSQASEYAVSEDTRSAIKERLRSINSVKDNFQMYMEEPKEG
jgi:hypothetical protein